MVRTCGALEPSTGREGSACGRAIEVETELVSLEPRSNLLTDVSQTHGNLVTSTHLFQLDHGRTFSLSDHLQSKQRLKGVSVDGAGE